MNNESVDTLSRRETLSYLSGLFDGEGWAGILRYELDASPTDFKYRSRLQVNMTDSGPVKLFHEMFGGSFSIRNPKPPRKVSYNWKVSGQRTAEVASQLIPFSHNDRKRAALKAVIDFGKTILSCNHGSSGVPFDIQQRRELLWKRCRALNATGCDANNQTASDLQAIQDLKPATAQLLLWNE